jgi:hypothetical protein
MEISAFFQDHRWIFDGKDAEVDSPEKTAVEVARRTCVAIYGEDLVQFSCRSFGTCFSRSLREYLPRCRLETFAKAQ